MIRTIKALLVLCLYLQIFGVEYTYADVKPGVTIDQAWIRLSPLKNRPSAAYALITGGKSDDLLDSAASPYFKRIEIHYSRMTDWGMTMEKLSSIAIPASQVVKLEPGGYHLMLFEAHDLPKKPSKTLPITLHFKNGGAHVIEFTIKPFGTMH